MNGENELTASPFHEGEQRVQERLGVREEIEVFARRVVRDHMPDQHREFYRSLPFVLLGTVDDNDRPWASLVAGRPGFMTTPDTTTLDIAAAPLFGDPLGGSLKPGAEVGILGLQLETRRRNRLTGRIVNVRANGFSVAIKQTFGNCPQYIQTRFVEGLPEDGRASIKKPVSRFDRFDGHIIKLIERSDTMFIATAYSNGQNDASQGGDVSHRGGRPGFIKVESDRSFVFPDYSGNNHFNTIGNIVLNPKAGILFVDFETGDLVTMTGGAEIIWDGDEVSAFKGAQRLIRFHVDEVIKIAGVAPLRFRFGDYSPMIDKTGTWQEAASRIKAIKQRKSYVPYEIFDIKGESETISSFYLRRTDGRKLDDYQPGQFLPIRLTIPGEAPVTRTYTLSDVANGDYYRLSIKREGGDARASNFLHDIATPGFALEAQTPRGHFTLDRSSDRPIVLVSAGVGITPMIAMVNAVVTDGQRTGNFRKTHFIHGALDGGNHAFGNHIRQLTGEYQFLSSHIVYSKPGKNDHPGITHDSEGRIDMVLLKQLLPFDDHDFYLCGPSSFMNSLHDGLTHLGVRGERIHFEAFGPASMPVANNKPDQKVPDVSPANAKIVVRFAKSDIETIWSPDKGTLLELAEAVGIQPDFSCRSGTCGSCATHLQCGDVDYVHQPSADHGDDDVLICCSTPKSSARSSCGTDQGVVLDL